MGALASGALAEVATTPRLWPTALVEWRALTPAAWWRRWPPVPGPARPYMSFRLETMYGSAHAKLSPSDLVGYLEWCRWMRSRAR